MLPLANKTQPTPPPHPKKTPQKNKGKRLHQIRMCCLFVVFLFSVLVAHHHQKDAVLFCIPASINN